MACNGKRDQFSLEDLLEAAKSADVKRPKLIISEVEQAIAQWPEFADKAEIEERQAAYINQLHRRFITGN